MPDPKPVPRLRELLEKATVLPWRPMMGCFHTMRGGVETDQLLLTTNKDGSMSKRHSGRLPIFLDSTGRRKRLDEDVAFIIAAVNAAPALLAALDLAHRLCERILNGDGESYFGDVTDLQDALYLLGVGDE